MPAVAWATVIISALIIAVAALGLLRVILHLHAVHTTLGTLIGGLRVVANKTSTVPDPAGLGEHQPQAGPRLLRGDLMNTGWVIGIHLGVVVVLVVVALVVPILVLAHRIGKQALDIDAVAAAGGHQHGAAGGAERHHRDTRR